MTARRTGGRRGEVKGFRGGPAATLRRGPGRLDWRRGRIALVARLDDGAHAFALAGRCRRSARSVGDEVVFRLGVEGNVLAAYFVGAAFHPGAAEELGLVH